MPGKNAGACDSCIDKIGFRRPTLSNHLAAHTSALDASGTSGSLGTAAAASGADASGAGAVASEADALQKKGQKHQLDPTRRWTTWWHWCWRIILPWKLRPGTLRWEEPLWLCQLACLLPTVAGQVESWQVACFWRQCWRWRWRFGLFDRSIDSCGRC